MAYIYHCRVAATFNGFTEEEFRSEKRTAVFSAHHLKNPVRMEALAFARKAPHELKGAKDLLFFHMIFKDPGTGRILYADRTQELAQYLETVFSWLGSREDKEAMFLAQEFLNRIHKIRFFFLAVHMVLQKRNPGGQLGMQSSPPVYFPLSDQTLESVEDLEHAFALHASFSFGSISDDMLREESFPDGTPAARRKSCLRLDMDRLQIPLEMLAADLCWKPVPEWEWLGFFPWLRRKRGRRSRRSVPGSGT